MFCIYLRTNSDLCHLQHKLIGFHSRDEKCLQRGTDWVFKYSGLRFVFKGLKNNRFDLWSCRKKTGDQISLLNIARCSIHSPYFSNVVGAEYFCFLLPQLWGVIPCKLVKYCRYLIESYWLGVTIKTLELHFSER